MGVALDYLYRDGSNNKFSERVVFAGALTDELAARLKATLDEGEFFIAGQVGVPEVFAWLRGYEPIGDVDHCWHQVCEVSATDEAPTDARTFAVVVEAFEAAERGGWREFEPMERAGQEERPPARRVNGAERTAEDDRFDVLTSAQDLEGSRAAEMMRTIGEAVPAPGRAHFTIDIRDGFVLLEDQGTGATITNAAAEVVAQLAVWGSLEGGRRVLYKDTSGQWDELLHKGGQFTGYAPIGARTPAAAMARAASRQRSREVVVRKADHSVLVPSPVSDRDLSVIKAVAVETPAAVANEKGGVSLTCRSLAAVDFAQRRLCAELDCRAVESPGAARVGAASGREAPARRATRARGRGTRDPFER